MFASSASGLSPTGLPLEFQASLFGGGAPVADARFRGVERTWLDDESWIDVVPGWLTGADTLLASLSAALPWRQRRVPMYERLVDEPRLVFSWSDRQGREAPVAPPGLLATVHELRFILSVRYGMVFDSFGCNLYRDGRDSVAWHRDRLGGSPEDPVVIPIVTLGGKRPFLIRPLGGGRSVAFLPASGDLVVLGGLTNQRWEHAVPKVRHADPRLSVAFRHDSAQLSQTGNLVATASLETLGGVRVSGYPDATERSRP